MIDPTFYITTNTGTDPVNNKTHPKLANLNKKALYKTEFLADKNKTNSDSNKENKPTETDAECADKIIELYNKKNQKKR